MVSPSALYILDSKGKILVYRNYRGDVSHAVLEKFVSQVLDNEDESSVRPVFELDGLSYAFVKHNNIYLVMISRSNSNAAMMIVYMHKIVRVFNDYFSELEEESIRDNFVVIHELLDEMMDFGYPQHTEPKILQEFITGKSHHLNRTIDDLPKVPIAVTQAVSWRKEGISYRKNEVFLDVVESLNMIVSPNGMTIRSEILGALKMRCFLSGMPELKLGLNDKVLFQNLGRPSKVRSVELDDVKFHQCVRLNRFETDRIISFIPPDGEFELMSYRLNTKVKPLFLVETVIERHSRSRVDYLIKVRSQYKRRSIANSVEVSIPVPKDADTPTFQTSAGTARYVPEKDVMVWSIKMFPGGKQVVLRARVGLPSIAGEENSSDHAKRPITIKYEIPYFTVSGLQVRYLKVIEKSGYQALPWVRYITQSGEYQVRLK